MHAWMRNGIMIESRGRGEERDWSRGNESTGIDRGRATFIVTRCLRYWTTTAIYPIEYPTSLGSMDSRKGTMEQRERGGSASGGARRVHPRSKAAHARSPSLWITALIESLSDVPWSRVILLPKQLLSSVVYSHLFHLAEPEPPPTLLPLLHFTLPISHDLLPPSHRHPFGTPGHEIPRVPKFTPSWNDSNR